MGAEDTLLSVRDLRVEVNGGAGWTEMLHGVGFDVRRGETLCIVGESGSGKSLTALSIMALLPPRSARVSGGDILFEGHALGGLSHAAMSRIRGRDIGMIFQEPMTSLNPALAIGGQIAEAFRLHTGAGRGAARARALEMLDMVRIPDAKRRLDAYPHELSGGMRQRVMIAMALAARPKLLIADEPTTALDVTVQAKILALINELKGELGTSVILITHDLGVVAEMADTVAVVKRGDLVESGGIATVFEAPRAPYTRALLAATPRIGAGSWRDGRTLATVESAAQDVVDRPPAIVVPSAAASPRGTVRVPTLSARDLQRHFAGKSGLFQPKAPPIRAVDGVSFDLQKGETLAIVGESGCGKSTLARLLMLRVKPTGGDISIDGAMVGRDRIGVQRARRHVQMVYQDPFASLHPRMTARDIVAEPLRNLGAMSQAGVGARVRELFDQVGLGAAALDRYPHEFSGGQRQRIAIARAIALKPAVVIADEPVSALDVSVQAQILNLLAELQRETAMSYLFISHDLSVVEYVSDMVAVMYRGRFVEVAPRAQIYSRPQHPYTVLLLNSVPSLDPRNRRFSRGDAPLPAPATFLSQGCSFRPYCPLASAICAEVEPQLEGAGDHVVACHFPGVAERADIGAAG